MNINYLIILISFMITFVSKDLHAIEINYINKSSFYKGKKEVSASFPKKIQKNKNVVDGIFLPIEEEAINAPIKKIDIVFIDKALDPSFLEQYLGKKISNKDLLEISNIISDYCIEKDYLLPEVSFDNEKLQEGHLKIEVTASSINEIIIEGDAKNNHLIKKYARKILESTPTKISVTQKYIALMSKVPGYEIMYDLVTQEETSNKEPLVDLLIESTHKNASVFTGTDNFGDESLGKYQGLVAGEYFTPFTSADSITTSVFTTNMPKNFSDLNLAYRNIINYYGTAINFSFSHSRVRPKTNSNESSILGSGNRFKIFMTHSLYLNAKHDLEFELGASHINKTKYQLINNEEQKSQTLKYNSVDAGLNYVFSDGINGHNLLNFKFLRGINGTFNNYNNTEDVDKHYKISKITFQRDQSLSNNFSAFLDVNASYSLNNLPNSEKVTFGGHEIGRGYDNVVLDGNRIIGGFLEMRYTKNFKDDPNLEDYHLETIQPYLYFDVGNVKDNNVSNTSSTLSSAGGGVRVEFINNINLGLEIAQPLKRKFFVSGVQNKSSTKFSFYINKIFDF